MTRKTVDTLKMVRAIREAHYQKLHGKPIAERLRFYKEQAEQCNVTTVRSMPHHRNAA
jgi:hypothetical protein